MIDNRFNLIKVEKARIARGLSLEDMSKVCGYKGATSYRTRLYSCRGNDAPDFPDSLTKDILFRLGYDTELNDNGEKFPVFVEPFIKDRHNKKGYRNLFCKNNS